MSVIGYSELVKEIYGVTPESIEGELSLLFKTKVNGQKIMLIKRLAISGKRATVSELMIAEGMNNTGASFRVVRNFFDELVKLKILKKDNVGRRTYYSFADDSVIRRWLI